MSLSTAVAVAGVAAHLTRSLRVRRQMKSVHFFDFAVSKEDVAHVPEGSSVRAPPLTAPQCLAIGRYLHNSVESFSAFYDEALLARLVVGSDCFLLNPRVPDESPNHHSRHTVAAASPVVALPLQAPFQSTATLDASISSASAAGAGAPSVQASVAAAAAASSGAAGATASAARVGGRGGSGGSGGGAAVSVGATSAAKLADLATPETTLYTRGKRSLYFTVILGGCVRIVAGREKYQHDLHTLSWLGEHALEFGDGFIPTFDAFAVTPCRVLKISASSFAAVRSLASHQHHHHHHTSSSTTTTAAPADPTTSQPQPHYYQQQQQHQQPRSHSWSPSTGAAGAPTAATATAASPSPQAGAYLLPTPASLNNRAQPGSSDDSKGDKDDVELLQIKTSRQ